VRLWEEFVKEGNKVPRMAEMKGSSQGGASSSRMVSSPHSNCFGVVDGRSVNSKTDFLKWEVVEEKLNK